MNEDVKLNENVELNTGFDKEKIMPLERDSGDSQEDSVRGTRNSLNESKSVKVKVQDSPNSQPLLGNKLPSHYENPFDNVCLYFAEKVSPFFYHMGATPNIITTFSVISAAMAVWNVYTGEAKTAFAFWALLSYFFDCLDGYFARKYGLCSKFGDYYDHLSDWAYCIALIYVSLGLRGFTEFGERYKILIYGALIFVSIATTVHMGLQELVYKKHTGGDDESPTLNVFAVLSKWCCADNVHDWITRTRWLGVGTLNLLVIAIVVLFVK
jgi:phosphatidylglycerophosphate synthase